jgi:hypothetical protein
MSGVGITRCRQASLETRYAAEVVQQNAIPVPVRRRDWQGCPVKVRWITGVVTGLIGF